MIDLDSWQEIFETISKNKLRTFLTAFSVLWGIFMLMLILGFSRGLQNGTAKSFEGDAVNSMWWDGGTTSKGFNGMGPGRKIRFHNDDRDMLSTIPGVEKAGSRQMTNQATVAYKNTSTSMDVMWIHPNYRYLEDLTVSTGRFLNETDYEEAHKVASVGKEAVKQLFPGGEDPLGKYVTINGVTFKVVGTFENPGGDRDNLRIYIPVTAGQKAYNGATYVDNINLVTPADFKGSSKELEEVITKKLREKYNVAPDDNRAFTIWNNLQQYEQIMGIFTVINVVVWVVGLMTLMAGIIGVANIMLITVKERTREIGIRKALGATPGSILSMIMQESILITLVSGYMGLVLGVLVLEQGWLLKMLSAMGITTDFLLNPSVDFGTAMAATMILVVAGSFAGLIPAIRAANINPMQAIRDE